MPEAPDNGAPDRLAQIYLAEFNAMRSEILQLSTKQAQYLVASFALIGYAYKERLHLYATDFAVASIALSALGMLFCDMDVAILRCASYGEHHIKKHLKKLVGDNKEINDEGIMEWERFIRGKNTILRKPILRPSTGRFQALMIAVPAAILMIVFITKDFQPLFFHVKDHLLKAEGEYLMWFTNMCALIVLGRRINRMKHSLLKLAPPPEEEEGSK